MSQVLLTFVELADRLGYTVTVVQFHGELTVRVHRRRVVVTSGVEIREAA